MKQHTWVPRIFRVGDGDGGPRSRKRLTTPSFSTNRRMETGFVPVQMLMDELCHKGFLRFEKPDPMVMLALVRQTRALALANPVMRVGGFLYKRSPVAEQIRGTIVRANLERVAAILIEHGTDKRSAEALILKEFDDGKWCMERDPRRGVCGAASPCFYHHKDPEASLWRGGVAQGKQMQMEKEACEAIDDLIHEAATGCTF